MEQEAAVRRARAPVGRAGRMGAVIAAKIQTKGASVRPPSFLPACAVQTNQVKLCKCDVNCFCRVFPFGFLLSAPLKNSLQPFPYSSVLIFARRFLRFWACGIRGRPH
jgi:hypothetical protein